jgi:O-antigen/teichoic acid export membrane protein
LRSLFGFGSYLLLSGLMSTLYSRLYTVLIGKMYSVRELGYYNRAAGTQGLPINILTGVIDRVGFPAFTLAAADSDFFQRSVRKVLRGAMLINAPAMLGILVTAKPLVATLFGDQWEPSAPILQVLCLAGLLWPLHVINLNVLMAQGHSNLFFRVGVAKQVLGVSVLLAASPFGILAIAWSEVVTGLASFLLNAHYTKVLLGYSALRQFRDFFPSLTVATLMAGIMWMVSLGIPSQCAAVQLMAQVFTGLFVYAGLCKLLRLEAFEEAWAILVGNLRQVHTDSTGQ